MRVLRLWLCLAMLCCPCLRCWGSLQSWHTAVTPRPQRGSGRRKRQRAGKVWQTPAPFSGAMCLRMLCGRRCSVKHDVGTSAAARSSCDMGTMWQALLCEALQWHKNHGQHIGTVQCDLCTLGSALLRYYFGSLASHYRQKGRDLAKEYRQIWPGGARCQP